MFSMIHDIVYHGGGGFDWHTIYNMPIWLRKLTYNKILKFLKDKNEAQSSTSSGNSSTRQIDFTKPPPSDIKPGQRI
jgi:hypothetical protein